MARPGRFSVASLLMFVTLMCVVLATLKVLPEFGLLVAIILVTAWLRTVSLVRRRLAHGFLITQHDQLKLFLKSFGTTAITMTLTVAAAVALPVMAIAVAITASEAGDWVAASACLIAACAIAVPAAMLMARFIDRRWKRDAGDDDGRPG